MSHRAVTWAYDQDIQPSAAKFVLVTLANYADEHGYCYPSQSRLADDTGQSERTVRTHLAALEAAGVIRRERRFDKAGHRTSDAFWLSGLPEKLAARPAEKSAGRRRALPAESSGRPPESFAVPTGNFRQSLPENPAAYIRNEPSYEPSVETTEGTPPLPPVREMPYAAFAAMCEGLGSDPKKATGRYKEQQIAISSDLLNDGYTCDQIRRVSRYIRSQTWRTGVIDMKTVSGVIGSWVLANEPERELPGSGRHAGHHADNFDYTPEEAAAAGRVNIRA